MIFSGGVNVYPQESESHLLTDPRVYDVAVIGVPNTDLGEEVKAVVVPALRHEPTLALAHDLIEYCRAHIAHDKCPRSIDFVAALPRTETARCRSAGFAIATGRVKRAVSSSPEPHPCFPSVTRIPTS